MNLSLGIDLGGTKLRGAPCRGLRVLATQAAESGEPPANPLTAEVRREPVGEQRDPASVVERVAEMVETLRDDADSLPANEVLPVGIGIAGMPRGREGFIVEAPNLGWTDVPFGQMLRERLGPDMDVRIVNDVNAVTYGEFALGAGVGSGDVLAVYVGTGVGGGLVCNGKLVEGAAGSAGEIGHSRVVRGPGARRCGCGKLGCAEAYAGGRALAERLDAEIETVARSRAAEIAGGTQDLTVQHLDRAAVEGDPYAVALWEEVADVLGTAIANAVTLLNPERLIFGGGVLWRTPDLKERVAQVVLATAARAAVASLTIHDAALGDDAGIVGAALLAAESS